jgi:hypothetical protein
MKRFLTLCLLTTIFGFTKGEDDVIDNYLGKIAVGDPVEYKNLKIFPLELKVAITARSFTTMDEAMTKGWLKIRESGDGEVNFVEVRNNGDEMVFLLTGEMITGAKQDRMLQQDLLVPAHSEWLRVPVFCVEHGRWVSVSPEFKSGNLLVPNAVRCEAKVSESQSDVWAGIARSQDELGVASGSGTVRANYEDEEVRTKVAEYEKHFEGIPKISKNTVGVIVTTGNRIICFDLFANNQLIAKLWSKLAKSYAMDAIRGEASTVDKDDIEDFIKTLENGKMTSTGTPGLGRLFEITTDHGKGSALVYENAVVHMDYFPADGTVINDDPELRLDFRRDQRLD